MRIKHEQEEKQNESGFPKNEDEVVNPTSVTYEMAAEVYVKLFNEEGLEVADEYLAHTYEELPQEVCDIIAKLLQESKEEPKKNQDGVAQEEK